MAGHDWLIPSWVPVSSFWAALTVRLCVFFFLFFVLPSLRGLAPAPVQDAVKLSIQFPKPFSSACSVWCAITLLVIHVSVDLIHALTETGVTLVFCGVSER